ncbi:hypothetical protein TorRG33x02_119290 [Trema orientale]|uniref:Uncharacterized protein n=1 Tax=Trema orientale TaxID=63057 RepID=A0A2P5F3C3_TREOI|nr:hypothetical protein TorRG33x02_119290 [Trema orientale]
MASRRYVRDDSRTVSTRRPKTMAQPAIITTFQGARGDKSHPQPPHPTNCSNQQADLVQAESACNIFSRIGDWVAKSARGHGSDLLNRLNQKRVSTTHTATTWEEYSVEGDYSPFPLPDGLKMPTIIPYEGKIDPSDHLNSFNDTCKRSKEVAQEAPRGVHFLLEAILSRVYTVVSSL